MYSLAPADRTGAYLDQLEAVGPLINSRGSLDQLAWFP
jgi:hypothetical protein